MQVTTEIFRKVFGKSRRSDFFGDFQDIAFVEDRFRRAVGYALCYVVFGLTSLSMLLNLYEGSINMVFVLGGVLLGTLCAFAWLWIDQNTVYGPLYIILGTLGSLGIYLLLNRNSPNGSLFWFLLFPPMVMLCLGLRQGTIAFTGFYLFVVLVMVTPLHSHLTDPLGWTARVRFVAAMMGAFVFAWSAEFLRYQAQFALGRTMIRLEQDSLTDPLTGLGNRRDFCNHCRWIVAGSSGKFPVISLAIVDIDHFKRINDTYGHEIGDKVLRHVAEVLGAQTRASDKLYRWGGEEFLVLMPRTAAREARLALERMRRTVADTPFQEDGLEIPFTVSIGLYSGTMQADVTGQIAKADQNLYAAKASGRNKVVG